jgi:hypothetical protein
MRSVKWIVFGIFLVLHGLMLLGMGLGGILAWVAGVSGIIAGVLFLINR